MRQKNIKLLASFLVLSSIILFLIAVPVINATNLNTKIEFQISGLSGVSQLDNTAGTSVKVYISNSTGIVVSRNAAAGIYLNNMTVSMTGDKFNLSYATSYTYILSTIYGNFSYNFTTPTAPSVAPTYPRVSLHTGQNVSYNSGDDALNDGTAKNFTDNGDGTINDTQTGLMWMKDDNGVTLTWYDAITFCQNNRTGGYNNWRLPSAVEAITLIDYGVSTASSNDFRNLALNWNGQYYWTSTTYPPSTAFAYFADFVIGFIFYDDKGNDYYYMARCVRSEN